MSIRTFICWYANPKGPPPDEVMARYDLIVGRGCRAERRNAIRNRNDGIRFVVYVNAIDCYLPRDVDDVKFSDVGRQRPEHRGTSHAAANVWADHRDFLLKNRRGKRDVSGDPRKIYAWGYQRPYDFASRYANRFFLDPRSGWKDYYPELCTEMMAVGNYDGVFCDNVGASIEWNFESVADDLKVDVTDEEWARANSTMLANVSRRLKRHHPDALTFANTCGAFVRADTDDIEPTDFWRDAAIDGAMDEFFAYALRQGGAESYLPETSWREQLRSILCCEKLGRAYFAQSNGDEHDHAARTYTLASFLIGAGENSIFNYNPAPAASYLMVYRFPEWDIDLGRPLVQYESVDEALATGQGKVYVREFERGLVLVNPTDSPADHSEILRSARRLVLEGGTMAHDGHVTREPVDGGLSLAPHTAEILILD